MTLIWNNNFKIGNQKLDEQHEQIFFLFNKFLSTRTKKKLLECTVELMTCIRSHFDYEEKLMRNTQFPDYLNHIEQHNKVMNQLKTIEASVEAEIYSRPETEKFIVSWATKHIAVEDVKLTKHLQLYNPKNSITTLL